MKAGMLAAQLAGLQGAVASLASRARLDQASLANPARTLMQVKSWANETLRNVELLLPYGMSALPIGTTADLLVFQLGAARDHLIGLQADDPALRITDLQPGEFGFRDQHGMRIVFRTDHLEIDTSENNLPIVVNTGSGDVTVTTTGTAKVTAAHARIDSVDVILGGTSGGKKVVLDGDPVVGGGGGTVQATSTHVKAI